MNSNQLQLPENLPLRSVKQKRNNSLKLLIFSLLGTSLIGYLIFREIQLNAAQQLIQDCAKRKNCSGIIEALEKLVKAKKSLKLSNLENAHLESANLSNAHLESAHLENAHLESANLSNAHLESVNLSIAHLENAHLENAHLESAHLSNTHLESINFSNAHLESAHLSNAYLEDTHLYHVNLSNANLSNANLSNAYFHRANLSSANLSSAKLYGAYFHRAKLDRANLSNTNLIDAKHLSPSQIKSACYWESAIYKGFWDLSQFQLVVDQTANQQFIEQLQQDKNSDPQIPVDCSQWER